MNAPTPLPEAPKCPFCDKEGLPILPTRYAVCKPSPRLRTQPPKLDPQFGGGVNDVAKLTDTTSQYTLRLLRGGYLYTFNEKRATWGAYVVTDAGYLYEFDFNDPSPPLPDQIEFSCMRKGDAVIARCITVKDAHVAGKVWIGFSDVLWTEEVKKRHRKESWRRKHMRCLDIAAWRAGGGQDHAAPMADAERLVAEFTVTGSATERAEEESARQEAAKRGEPSSDALEIVVISYPAYGFSPHTFDGQKEQVPDLLTWAEKAAKPYRPMMTALWDPVGIVSELDPLMSSHFDNFLYEDNDRARKMAVSSAIQSIRESIGNLAEIEYMRRANQDADDMAIYGGDPKMAGAMNPGGGGAGAMAAGKLLSEWVWGDKVKNHYKSMEEAFRMVAPETLDRIHADAWSRYQTRIGGKMRYDEAARAAFQKSFDDRLLKFDNEIILPLANAHKAWMTSQAMANVFEANYDEADAQSGEAYVTAVTICVGNTQDKKPCFDLYSEWLQGDPTDKRNLVMRALGFNQQSVLEQAKKATSGGIDPWAMSWPSLIKSYEFADKQLTEGRANVITHLIVGLNGPFAAVLSKLVDAPAHAVTALCGMISGKAMIPVHVEGSYKDFRRELVQKIRKGTTVEGGGKVPSRAAMYDPVDLELLRLQARGVPMEGTTSRRFFILVDANYLANVPGNLTKAERTRYLAKSMRVPNLMQLPDSWRSIVNTDVRIGSIGLLVDAVLLIKLWKDSDDIMQHKWWDTWCRVGGGTVGVLGGSLELFSKAAMARVNLGARFGRALSRTAGKVTEFIGRRLTAVAGFAMAVFDFVEAGRELRQGNYVVSGLYVLSGIAGLVMVWAVWVGATGWGIAAAIVLLVVAGLLAWLVDDKIQDWLERCIWGSLTSERYGDSDVEMKELSVALKD
ncbi:T6SS effector BTH_I2691 family protein [Cupriavidus plantarum]|uniref:T6SS effector BTH_I2691 family protein n=1 Tax=Cupriavidus plantarum TaxID=942865 RepID=UPI00339D7F18